MNATTTSTNGTSKKLAYSSETLRTLTPNERRLVAGGGGKASNRC